MNEKVEKQLRDGLQGLLGIMYEDSKELRKAAEALGLPFETARQARDYGKGSVTTINGLILHGFGVTPEDLPRHLPKIRKMLGSASKMTTLEKLFESALAKYGQNDLIAWLRLLLVRYDIERELGIRKGPGRPPKKSQ